MRVLVIDDDPDVRSVVARALEKDGHALLTASTLQAARNAVHDGVDLVVLDLGLPDGRGIELCRELREDGSSLPILILTANSQVATRVEGLDAGADDFLAKPFAVAELRARVRALGRRRAQPRQLAYSHGAVKLDLAGRRATRNGTEVPITAREWSLLELLAGRAGRVVPRDELLEGVWGDITESAAGSLEVLIARLRRKLGAELIETLRGHGYRLAAPESRDA